MQQWYIDKMTESLELYSKSLDDGDTKQADKHMKDYLNYKQMSASND